MDLADLLTALQRRWTVLLLVALPILAGVVWYGQTLPVTYEVQSVVAFQPRADTQIGADVVRLILPRYTAILAAPSTVESLAAAVDADADAADLRDTIFVTIPAETSNLEITVEDTDPRRAAQVANAMAGVALEAAVGDTLLEAEQVVTALPPREPSGPARRLLVAAGGVVALFAGIAAAFAAERLHPGARTMAEIEEALQLPVVGTLPAASSTRSIAALLGDASFGGSVRLLRTNLGQLQRSDSVRVLGVTSVGGGDDPATAVCALASSLAAVNAKVLLIDGDLTTPMINQRLGLSPGPGLSAVLRGTSTLDDAAVRSGTDRLDVLAGPADPDAVDHLAQGFPGLRREAQSTYDFVVVAAPDLLGSGVAPLLTALVDGVLLVVERGANVRELREAVRILALLNARTLGAVTVG